MVPGNGTTIPTLLLRLQTRYHRDGFYGNMKRWKKRVRIDGFGQRRLCVDVFGGSGYS